MRIYNKWYEELWFWIQENINELICILFSLVLIAMSIRAFIYFNGIGE